MIDRQVEDFLNSHGKEKPAETFRQENAVEVSKANLFISMFLGMPGEEIRDTFLEVFRRQPILCRIIGNAARTQQGMEALVDQECYSGSLENVMKKMLTQKAQGPPADRPIDDDEDENIFEK